MNWRGEDPGYPPGATHDPNAPYNEPSYKELTFDVEAVFTISRADIEVETDDYEIDNGYAVLKDDNFDCNPVEAMKEAAEWLVKYQQLLTDKGDTRTASQIDDVLFKLKEWQVDDYELNSNKIDIEPDWDEDRGSDWREE